MNAASDDAILKWFCYNSQRVLQVVTL